MKAKFLLFLGVVLLLMTSCMKKEEFPQPQDQIETPASMSREQLNQAIFDILREKKEFRWNDLNDDQLTSAFLMSEQVITVAWDENSSSDTERRLIIDFIYQSEGKSPNEEGVILEIDNDLNLLHSKIDKVETLIGLRHLKETVALDVYYEIFTEDEIEQAISDSRAYSSGSFKTTNGSYSPITNHQVPAAWNAGLSGAGFEIGVIDNGPNNIDPIWGPNGNPHQSNPQPDRSVTKTGRYKTPWWAWWKSYDGSYNNNISVQHGSLMLDIIGKPLMADSSRGVAYRADIRSVRGAWLAWIDLPANVVGVTRSFNYLAERSNVKVISMSMGGLVHWTSIERAIKRCHDNGKLVITSGGTLPGIELDLIAQIFGFSWREFTVYPARSQYTTSATGIATTNDLNNAYWCPNCHGQTDFVVEFDERGSSSESAAMTAGMAALMWAREPHLNRSDILGKMKAAADRPTSNSRHNNFGHGRINMQTYVNNEGL